MIPPPHRDRLQNPQRPLDYIGQAIKKFGGEADMRIKQTSLPLAVNASMSAIRWQLCEYLRLEEATEFEENDFEFLQCLTANGSVTFVIFEYSGMDGPGIAFVQFPVAGSWSDGSIACWPHDPNRTIEQTVLEYLEYNPLNRQ